MEFRKLENLIKGIQTLSTKYNQERTKRDGERTLAYFRSATNNPKRKDSIQFLQELAKSTNCKKEFYHRIDPDYPKSHTGTNGVKQHLKDVIAGAILLELHGIIEGEYSGNEEKAKNSALVGELFDVLNIKSWADVPAEVKKDCWEAEKRYLEVISKNNEPEDSELIKIATKNIIGKIASTAQALASLPTASLGLAS